MTAAVETMAYNRIETPWHGLGVPVDGNLTAAQMLTAAGLDWTVSKVPVYFGENGSQRQVPDYFAIKRDTDGQYLSLAGKGWKPVQNEEALDFFKRFVDAGQMTMETAGSLQDGKYVWALARIGKDFSIGKGSNTDEVRGYLLLSSPHVCGKSMVAQFTPIRVVCWNTITAALGRNLKGDGSGFRLVHSQKFDAKMKEKATIALGLAVEQLTEFKEAAKVLSSKRAAAEEVENFFCQILKFDPEKAKKLKSGENREPRALPMFRTALVEAPGAQLTTALGTWWGALNSVTYVADHELGKTRDSGLQRAWMGDTATLKLDALKLALEKAA